MVYEGVSLVDACPSLGTELDIGFGLSPDYWPKVRLEDADDAVSTLMHVVG